MNQKETACGRQTEMTAGATAPEHGAPVKPMQVTCPRLTDAVERRNGWSYSTPTELPLEAERPLRLNADIFQLLAVLNTDIVSSPGIYKQQQY